MQPDDFVFDTLKEWDSTIVAIARSTVRRFPMVDWQDVAQELRLWWLSTSRVKRYLKPDQDEDTAKINTKKLMRALSLEASRHCQVEKAQSLGYRVDDLFFYSTGALREILPLLYEYDAWLPFTKDTETMNRGGGDPAEGGNLLATLVDVSRAVGEMSETDRELIEQLYRDGLTEDELSVTLGITTEAVNKRHDRTLARLRDRLGGEQPPFHDGPGARRAVSRAAAMAMTGEED